MRLLVVLAPRQNSAMPSSCRVSSSMSRPAIRWAAMPRRTDQTRARSRRPGKLSGIALKAARNGSRTSAVFLRNGRRWARRIPAKVAEPAARRLAAGNRRGDAGSAGGWRSRKVLTASPLPASAARNAATVSGDAGNAVCRCAAHHSVSGRRRRGRRGGCSPRGRRAGNRRRRLRPRRTSRPAPAGRRWFRARTSRGRCRESDPSGRRDERVSSMRAGGRAVALSRSDPPSGLIARVASGWSGALCLGAVHRYETKVANCGGPGHLRASGSPLRVAGAAPQFRHLRLGTEPADCLALAHPYPPRS